MKLNILNRFVRLASSAEAYWRKKKFTADENVYIFMPINGAGLGHLTRSLAIAKRLRERKPESTIIFFTTSIAVNLVNQFGFICYHIPPAALTERWLSNLQWNLMLRDALTSIIRNYRPKTLVFDGTSPYLGLRMVMRRFSRVRYVWVRRELFKSDVDLQKIAEFDRMFDLSLIPGEVGETEVDAGRRAIHLGPITLLNSDELLDRETARSILRLGSKAKVAYVQLGAGNINGIAELEKKLIDFLHSKGFVAVLGRSPITLSGSDPNGADVTVVDYPNARYFDAFDIAVLASGYNSVTEAVCHGLPAILVPNLSAKADDQLRRAKNAKTCGSYDFVTTLDLEKLAELFEALSNSDFSHRKRLPSEGATQAAELL